MSPSYWWWCRILVLALVLCGSGCGGASEPQSTGEQAAPSAKGDAPAPKAEPNYIVGKITMADGTPLRGEILDIKVSIYGVSEAAEKVHYGPIVKPDGAYRQKVAPGQYAFNSATMTVLYNETEFTVPLEPIGRLWNKNRDAAEGIEQNFVWKPAGITPYGQSNGGDIGNATHWYGMSIGVRPDGYRNDIKKVPPAFPKDTKFSFTLKPLGPGIDGTTPEARLIERIYDPDSFKSMNLNDLLPAGYELTATATLPDGVVKPLLLQGPGDYPNYKPALQIKLEKDKLLGGFFGPQCTFVME